MNDVQSKIAELVDKGWTLAAIADEVGHTSDAVELWKAGKRYPVSAKAILEKLQRLSRKRPPKKRRYAKGARARKGSGPRKEGEE